MTPIEWARYALTGNAESDTPTDGQLVPLIDSVSRLIKGGFPCVGVNPEASLSGADLAAWREWVGYAVAAKFLGTPGGKPFVSQTTEIKVGPVTKRVQGAGTLAEQQGNLLSLANAARDTITCIAAAKRNVGTPRSMFGLAGYRRGLEQKQR